MLESKHYESMDRKKLLLINDFGFFFILLLRFRSIIHSCSYIGCLKRGVVKHFFKIASCSFFFLFFFFSCNFFSVKQDYYFILFNFQLIPRDLSKSEEKK